MYPNVYTHTHGCTYTRTHAHTHYNYINEIDNVQYAKLLWVTISSDLTWNKHVENIVAKAGKRVYMLYQLKRAGIGQHDLVTIYVSVLLLYYYPGNAYAAMLCLTNLPCLKERQDSLCKNYFQIIMETTHRLNYLFLVRDATSMMYEDSISAHYPKSVRIDTPTH